MPVPVVCGDGCASSSWRRCRSPVPRPLQSGETPFFSCSACLHCATMVEMLPTLWSHGQDCSCGPLSAGVQLSLEHKGVAVISKARVARLFVRSLIVILTAAIALLLVAITSALPPVLDIRPALVVTSVLAAILHLAVSRQSYSKVRRVFTLLLAVALAFVALATVYDLPSGHKTPQQTY